MIAATQKKAKEADIAITKTIEDCKALIAQYYKAIENFDNHMLGVRNREIRRIALEGTEEEKEQASSIFDNV